MQPAHVIHAYKNFGANRHVSHIGLGVTALNCAKCLREIGIKSEVWSILDSRELRIRSVDSDPRVGLACERFPRHPIPR